MDRDRLYFTLDQILAWTAGIVAGAVGYYIGEFIEQRVIGHDVVFFSLPNEVASDPDGMTDYGLSQGLAVAAFLVTFFGMPSVRPPKK